MFHGLLNYPTIFPVLGIGLGWLIVLILGLWDLVWKCLGMWRAAQRRETIWFIAIFLFNTLGILPILYLYVFSKPQPKA